MKKERKMVRKIASVTLLVSLIALVSSGMMMIFIGSFEFNLRMHPVHKIFGILMTVSGILHVYFNFKSIKKYLGAKKILVFGIVLTLFMTLLYFAGLKKPLDQNVIQEIESNMMMLEKGH
jgi:hypothetical protein